MTEREIGCFRCPCGPVTLQCVTWSDGFIAVTMRVNKVFLRAFDVPEDKRSFGQRHFAEYGEIELLPEDVEQMYDFLSKYCRNDIVG